MKVSDTNSASLCKGCADWHAGCLAIAEAGAAAAAAEAEERRAQEEAIRELHREWAAAAGDPPQLCYAAGIRIHSMIKLSVAPCPP
jgi:hypothetical protein